MRILIFWRLAHTETLRRRYHRWLDPIDMKPSDYFLSLLLVSLLFSMISAVQIAGIKKLGKKLATAWIFYGLFCPILRITISPSIEWASMKKQGDNFVKPPILLFQHFEQWFSPHMGLALALNLWYQIEHSQILRSSISQWKGPSQAIVWTKWESLNWSQGIFFEDRRAKAIRIIPRSYSW